MVFRVGVTHDIEALRQRTGLDAGLARLEREGFELRVIPPGDRPGLQAGEVADLDGLVLLKRVVDDQTLQGDRLKLVARFGVGLDNVDVDACSRRGVCVTTAADGVRRPVAAAMLTMLLALSHNLLQKDRLLRSGSWDREAHLGTGLTGRVVSLVGYGNIGRDFAHLIEPLEVSLLVHDPFAPSTGEATLVDLETAVREADFLVLACPLTRGTHHLIDSSRLATMKRGASLLNLARGPIVDEAALYQALVGGAIRGAALDVYDPEPPAPDNPLFALDNVICTPHSLAWTDELVSGNGQCAVEALVDIAAGILPSGLVNPCALQHPRWNNAQLRTNARS